MKTETQHTPGPWIVSRIPAHSGELVYCLIGRNPESNLLRDAVAFAGTYAKDMNGNTIKGKRIDAVQCEANARLIAAAPALLNACKEMLGYIEIKLAHRGSMNVDEIMTALELVKEQTPYIETSHHVGCAATTRRVDLEAARSAIATAEGKQ